MKKPFFIIWAALCISTAFIGCQSLDRSARDGIAAFKGYLEQAITRRGPECVASNGTAKYCDAIKRAASAENAAVSALAAYCQFTPFDAQNTPDKPCSPVKDLEGGLKSALANLNQLSGEIKAAAQ